MRKIPLRRRRRGAAKAKRLVPQEALITWSLRLPESVDAALKARAEREGRSGNSMAVRLLTEALQNELARLNEEHEQRLGVISAEGGEEPCDP
jgi:plasmid stability protein